MENKESLAMELIKDYKKDKKRLFVILIVILSMWFATIGLFVYYINTTGYEEITEISDTSDASNFYNNDIILITTRGHIVCAKYGIIYDTWDSSNRKVEFIWKVN